MPVSGLNVNHHESGIRINGSNILKLQLLRELRKGSVGKRRSNLGAKDRATVQNRSRADPPFAVGQVEARSARVAVGEITEPAERADV